MLQTPEKPADPRELSDDDALPIEELRRRLYLIASEVRLILLAARAINEDDGAGGVDNCDPNA